MAKYRKKPVVIEAMHFTGKNEVALNVWVGKWHKRYEEVLLYKDDRVYVNTLEGLMLISVNDYLIRGIKGEFYPCKPDIFEATYEVVKPLKDTSISLTTTVNIDEIINKFGRKLDEEIAKLL